MVFWRFRRIRPWARILDLIQDTFCGQGLFTLAFRHRHPQLRVVSIDRSGPALQQLQLNLDNHGLEDVDVVQGGELLRKDGYYIEVLLVIWRYGMIWNGLMDIC